MKNWVLASVEDQLALSGRVMESIGLDTYEREFDCYVRLPGQPEDDYTLTGEIRFWVNVLDEMAAQGEEEPLEEQPLVLETTVTISQERLGPSAVAMWDRVSAELSSAHADRAHLSLVQRYDAGSFDPAEAEAQIVAEWVRDPDSINETYVHEVISTFAEILRLLDEEYPLPEEPGE
ncbi:MAG: hypothetical protein QJR08_04950 [Bacillota bacterium]|nr:hypothetical protein [Bacillota bacterium]